MKSQMTWFNLLHLTLLLLPALATAANQSLTEAWVLTQIQKAQNQSPGVKNQLTAADWNAACTRGSPVAPTGCLGNVSSIGFQKLSNGTGGFTTWANIQPMNAPQSVFIKAFLAGANVPVDPPNININVPEGAARCGLFTTPGEPIGMEGISNLNPTPGNSLTETAPFGLIIAFNMSSGGFTYEHSPIPFEADPQDPIYVMCVAYDPADGASAVSSAGSITAN